MAPDGNVEYGVANPLAATLGEEIGLGEQRLVSRVGNVQTVFRDERYRELVDYSSARRIRARHHGCR